MTSTSEVLRTEQARRLCAGRCALQTQLPRGVGYGTLDISVRYVKRITTARHTVVTTGEVVHLGRRTATGQARLVQQDGGALLATATSTLLLFRP